MSKYLFAVDVQPEFVCGLVGRSIYTTCINYIGRAKESGYDKVFALAYKPNKDFCNMQRYLHWECPETFHPLEFKADEVLYHDGYSAEKYPKLTCEDQVDIIGFDTDACVLSTAFDIFNMCCKLQILQNLCWSSGGEDMHYAALQIMQRQFGDAVVTQYEEII